MFNRVEELDEFILSRCFDPAAWWAEYHFGLRNYRLAQYMLLVSIIGYLVDGIVLMGIVLSLYVFLFERFKTLMGKNGLGNLFRYRLLFLRICSALFVFFDTTFWDANTPTIVADIVAYMAVCFASSHPMPPWYEEQKRQQAGQLRPA